MRLEAIRDIIDEFSSEITLIYRYLREDRKEYKLSGQLIRASIELERILHDSESESNEQLALTKLNIIIRLRKPRENKFIQQRELHGLSHGSRLLNAHPSDETDGTVETRCAGSREPSASESK